VWISVAIALANVAYVLTIEFAEHFKNGSGKDAQDNGLFVYVEDRGIYSVFIIDRSKYSSKASELSPVKEVFLGLRGLE
jgi:hypothetical protein